MLRRVWLLFLTLLTHYRRHPSQALFLLLGLSLGISLFQATLLISDAGKRSFDRAQQTLAGATVARIVPAAGAQYLDEALYRQLRSQGVNHLFPLIEGRLALQNGRFLNLQGVNLFSLLYQSFEAESEDTQPYQNQLEPLAKALTASGHHLSPAQLLLEFSYPPYLVLASASYAKALELRQGAPIVLADKRQLPALSVVADELNTGYRLLCDLRCGQHYLNRPQQLSAILVSQLTEQQFNQLEGLIAGEAELKAVDKQLTTAALADAFFLNLTAIGGLAFLVGCFLAFNAVRFAVLQRLQMVQLLRLTGATVAEIGFALVLELLLWALLASLCGNALAFMMAAGLLPSIGFTLAQLFFNDNSLLLTGFLESWWQALALALLATSLAIARPFWQLAQQVPLTQSKWKNPSATVVFCLAAVLLIAVSLLLLWLPSSQLLGLVVISCWLLAGAFVVPFVLLLVFRLLRCIQPLQRFPTLHWVFADADHQSDRLSVSLMAFTVSVAASIAIVTMVGSFRQAFDDYLQQALSESLYLTPDVDQVEAIERFLDSRAEVVLRYRFILADAEINDQPGYVRALSNDVLRQNSVPLEQALDQVWSSFHQREGVLVNQTLALQQRLKPGDKVTLSINQQRVDTQVLAVYYSYGSMIQSSVIDQQWLAELWPTLSSQRLGVFIRENADIEPLVLSLTEQFALPSHQLIKPSKLQTLARTVFEQTFNATYLLAGMILLVAAIGIYCANHSGQRAQQREYTLLTVLGVSTQKLLGLALLQLLLSAFIGCLIALPLGLLVAWASIEILLHDAFGWTFALQVEPLSISLILVMALLLVGLAAFWPMYQRHRRSSIAQLSEVL